ncbi:MAG TPA: hypothetical protein VGC55_02080 [Dokdonella sp.]
MFPAYRKSTFTAALAVLAIALPFGTLAFAQSGGSAGIANAERAAQSVIADTASPTHSPLAVSSASSIEGQVTLAQNERAAQRAIVDSPVRGVAANDARHETIGAATLAQAERAAQQAITGSSIGPRTVPATHAGSIGAATHAPDETFSHGN